MLWAIVPMSYWGGHRSGQSGLPEWDKQVQGIAEEAWGWSRHVTSLGRCGGCGAGQLQMVDWKLTLARTPVAPGLQRPKGQRSSLYLVSIADGSFEVLTWKFNLQCP